MSACMELYPLFFCYGRNKCFSDCFAVLIVIYCRSKSHKWLPFEFESLLSTRLTSINSPISSLFSLETFEPQSTLADFSHHQWLRIMICKSADSVLASTRSSEEMNSSTQFISSMRMDVYEPMHHIGLWRENFTTPPAMITEADSKLENQVTQFLINHSWLCNRNRWRYDLFVSCYIQSDEASFGSLGHHNIYANHETAKPVDKVKRRLAQNREAARKSRLRKKAYIHQLETSRSKLIQLEQELDKARQQGLYVDCRLDSNQLSFSGTVNSSVTAFETEYGQWVEEQNRQIREFRTALRTDITDLELRIMVENGMRHYFDLFRMKARAAKADVFYVMNGVWKTSTERLFLWIGGSRPSELLEILAPQLDTLTKQQVVDVHNLQRSCKQAEEALLQGMEKLRQALIDVVVGQLAARSHPLRPETAMERLEDLVGFVNQADHLRQESLQQMYKILTTRQSAQGLLVLGEYFQRLRALSSLSSNSPHNSA